MKAENTVIADRDRGCGTKVRGSMFDVRSYGGKEKDRIVVVEKNKDES